jgi:hypothetical protein
MAEQTLTQEGAPKITFTNILRQVVQWAVLALLAFTCIMAAYRKFGG